MYFCLPPLPDGTQAMPPKVTPVDVPVEPSPSLGFESDSSFGHADSAASGDGGDDGAGQQS